MDFLNIVSFNSLPEYEIDDKHGLVVISVYIDHLNKRNIKLLDSTEKVFSFVFVDLSH